MLRREKSAEEGRTMLSMTLWLLTVLVPLQIFLGDHHGPNTLKYQPAKLAAIEAHWETGRRVPITLFAIPAEKTEANHFSLDVPLVGSLILTHEIDGEEHTRRIHEQIDDQIGEQRDPYVATMTIWTARHSGP